MPTSQKFHLQWNEFQKNITTSIKDFRGDFCDITLVSEDNIKIEAHKVILAASSNLFRDILGHNSHPNPLIYMRGIKDDHLAAAVDFIYHGQTSINEENINDFLQVAGELQLKGLSGTEEPNLEMNKDLKNIQTVEPTKKLDTVHIPFCPKLKDNGEHISGQIYNDVIDQTIMEDTIDVVENRDQADYENIAETRISTTNEQLAETIKLMLEKVDGIWRCTQCGKTNKDRSNMRKHIETNHIEGISYTCDQCQKQCRSKSGLYQHRSSNLH